MKKLSVLLLTVLLFLLSLTSCARQNEPAAEETPPPVTQEPSKPQKPEETPVGDAQKEKQEVISVEHMTVELVSAWEDGDRLLSQLKSLSHLMQSCMLTQGYQVEDITITISTAGGFTADALNNGGVDLAFLPAVDYITCDKTITAVLTTDEEICTTVVAVNSLQEEFDAEFSAALTRALLETDSGKEFLTIYDPDITCIPATESAIQVVRDRVAEQEKEERRNPA